jgi:hypothetical protein
MFVRKPLELELQTDGCGRKWVARQPASWPGLARPDRNFGADRQAIVDEVLYLI